MQIKSLILAALITACSQGAPTENSAAPAEPAASSEAEMPSAGTPKLQQVWQTDGFSDPEGVAVYNDVLFISNVSGEAADKDGEGWISRVSMDGRILDAQWAKGLNAPKGMAVRGDVLFVTDIDAYHTIDVETGEIINTYDVPEAGFLNDVTVWQNGVFASDSATGTIFQLDVNGYKAWREGDDLGGLNGLLPQGDTLLAATMSAGQLVSISGDQTVTEIASGMPDADGIAILDDGSYLVSSWPGRIWHVGTDGRVVSLLNTEPGEIYQNDLTRVGDLIIVPNWKPGSLTAWQVE